MPIRSIVTGIAIAVITAVGGCSQRPTSMPLGVAQLSECDPSLTLFSSELIAMTGGGEIAGGSPSWPKSRRDGELRGDGDQHGISEMMAWTTYRDQVRTINGRVRVDLRSTTYSTTLHLPRRLWQR